MGVNRGNACFKRKGGWKKKREGGADTAFRTMHISGSAVWKFIQFVFIVCPSQGLPKYFDTKKVLTICFYLIKLFQETKSGLELVSLPHFLHDFWRKMFLALYSINWSNFIEWLSLLLEILGNKCIVIIFFQLMTSSILNLALAFLSSRFVTWR